MNHKSNLFYTFFHKAGVPIFVIHPTTKTVTEANIQAMEYSGYGIEELRGLAIDRLFQFRNSCEILFEKDKPDMEVWVLLKKNGGRVTVNLTTTWVDWDSQSYLFIMVPKPDGKMSPCDEAEGGQDAIWQEAINFPTIIGHSQKIRDVCRLIGSVAKSDATVLIQGESGTGKEIVANAIQAHSFRGQNPFVKVNCAALTETLLESELFGHVKGAFTGAIRDRRGRFKQADRGTILLDEIGSMSLAAQSKLLRVLQEREFEPVGSSMPTSVDVRVLASTNTDLHKAVAEGKFREDLYYRLNVFMISLPPLRERKEDIPLLAKHFLKRYAQAIGKNLSSLMPETLTLLLQHDWPGNARELENAIEHAVIVENGSAISPSSLPINLAIPGVMAGTNETAVEQGLRVKLMLLEKEIILEALVRANGIMRRAATMLQIDPRNLPYLLRKHHLRETIPHP
ncbi:MAG: sigma 54-interacting transcriptional regulator [Nitrospira sp.]|nr:sigma 54-interacting transcriptional regulator [Nitrospira sp.]